MAEKKAQKSKSVAAEIDGFKVKLDGSEVELIKTNDKEKYVLLYTYYSMIIILLFLHIYVLLSTSRIIVSFNINHTVDTDEEAEVDPTMDKPEFGEMKSKPTCE